MIQDIAPHQFDNVFVRGAEPGPDSPVYCFMEDKLLIRSNSDRGKKPGQLVLPRRRDFGGDVGFIRLFALDGTDYYLALPRGRCHETRRVLSETQIYQDKSADRQEGDGAREDGAREAGSIRCEGYAYERLHRIRADQVGQTYQYFAAVTAYQLFRWYEGNRFCGHCGSRMTLGERERVLICPCCGSHIYPKIMPAVIVGVIRGDQILMTRYRDRGIDYHALVAGFVEIGETFEDAVRREVMEETGLRVKNIRYYKSQPWGIVDDLLAGFYCDVDGPASIRIDKEELREAGWFDRDQVCGQPDQLSLTNEMMLCFRDGREPGGSAGM